LLSVIGEALTANPLMLMLMLMIALPSLPSDPPEDGFAVAIY
jgi:hypothetical protein